MTEIRLERRSLPDRLRYLADGFLKGHIDRVAVIVMLNAMAEETDDKRGPAPGPAHVNCVPGELLTCQRAGSRHPCRSDTICDFLAGGGR